MSRELPAKPNLEHLKNQAKELLEKFEQGDSQAKERLGAIRWTGARPKLADALHEIAREYGFTSWAKLKERVEWMTKVLPPELMLTQAIRASDAKRTTHVLEEHPELKATLNGPLADYGGGLTALLAAVQYTDRKTIEVLLGAGADINQRGYAWDGGLGVLDECAAEIADFLIERGAKMDAQAAARLGRIDELGEMIEANPEVVKARGAHGQTPLHFASTVEIARLLVEHGAEMDARDVLHESTPAQHMLRVVQARHYKRDRLDIARFLVERGCRTDLLMASALGDRELVTRILEENPESIRMRVSEEYFPKQDARSEGTIYHEMFGPGRTAHPIARDFGHDEVFRFLMERTPEDLKLSLACELGDEGLFRELLEKRPKVAAELTEE